jgi:acetylornithine deacetylase/succinyl-diaminopimelate desuccinylase-like protein
VPRNLAGTDPPAAETVSDLMPALQSDLVRLVAIPSISSPGYPEPRQPILDAYALTVELLRDAGVQDLGALELPDTAPVITGGIPAPEGAPTVLLFALRRRAGRRRGAVELAAVRGRRARRRGLRPRDGGLQVERHRHIGALRAWEGRPPVGIKIVIEGQEEVGGGALTTYPPAHPEAFRCDAMVIGDMGSVRPGVPTLTVALRGMAMVTIEVTTLAGAKHSGQDQPAGAPRAGRR